MASTLRILEDFLLPQSEIPDEKLQAYRDTEYRFGRGHNLITLRIDARSEELGRLYASTDSACGVFITAYNPLGQAQNIEANVDAHARLGAELKALTTRVFEGAGADPTGAWPEEKSFFALGVGLEEAQDLGIRYQQDAIVWAGSDAVARLVLLR